MEFTAPPAGSWWVRAGPENLNTGLTDFSRIDQSPMARRSEMAKIIATTFGGILALFGVAGFFSPTFCGALCSPVHNFLCILTGAAVVCVAQKGGPSMHFWVIGGMGVGSLACGIIGVLAGRPGTPGFPGVPPDDRLLLLIPKVLEWGTSNHLVNLFFGVALLTTAVVSATETPFRLRK